MDRISTAYSFQSSLLNMQSAQVRLNTAETQMSTQKLGADLKAFSDSAATLTATKTLQARVKTHIATSAQISDKLTVQEQALQQVDDAASKARDIIVQTLTTGNADLMMSNLQIQFDQANSGLNSQYKGQYLFAGGQSNTAPSKAGPMSDLTDPANPTTADLFANGGIIPTSRLDDSTVMNTGFVASDVATSFFDAMKSVQAFQEGPDGPFKGALTQPQQDFLSTVLAQFDQSVSDLTHTVALNGEMQNRVDSNKDALTSRDNALTSLVGNMTEVDPTEVAARLQLARTAVDASAQVFAGLKQSSLLNYLQGT